MERIATFRFREADLPLLLILLGEFGWMVPPGKRHPALLRRLRKAQLVQRVEGIEPFECWVLTEEGKTAVKRALG